MTPGQDSVIRALKRDGVEVTRLNYIAYNWSGTDVGPWTPELEDELPENLQDWSLFAQRGDDLVYVGPTITY